MSWQWFRLGFPTGSGEWIDFNTTQIADLNKAKEQNESTCRIIGADGTPQIVHLVEPMYMHPVGVDEPIASRKVRFSSGEASLTSSQPMELPALNMSHSSADQQELDRSQDEASVNYEILASDLPGSWLSEEAMSNTASYPAIHSDYAGIVYPMAHEAPLVEPRRDVSHFANPQLTILPSSPLNPSTNLRSSTDRASLTPFGSSTGPRMAQPSLLESAAAAYQLKTGASPPISHVHRHIPAENREGAAFGTRAAGGRLDQSGPGNSWPSSTSSLDDSSSDEDVEEPEVSTSLSAKLPERLLNSLLTDNTAKLDLEHTRLTSSLDMLDLAASQLNDALSHVLSQSKAIGPSNTPNEISTQRLALVDRHIVHSTTTTHAQRGIPWEQDVQITNCSSTDDATFEIITRPFIDDSCLFSMSLRTGSPESYTTNFKGSIKPQSFVKLTISVVPTLAKSRLSVAVSKLAVVKITYPTFTSFALFSVLVQAKPEQSTTPNYWTIPKFEVQNTVLLSEDPATGMSLLHADVRGIKCLLKRWDPAHRASSYESTLQLSYKAHSRYFVPFLGVLEGQGAAEPCLVYQESSIGRLSSLAAHSFDVAVAPYHVRYALHAALALRKLHQLGYQHGNVSAKSFHAHLKDKDHHHQLRLELPTPSAGEKATVAGDMLDFGLVLLTLAGGSISEKGRPEKLPKPFRKQFKAIDDLYRRCSSADVLSRPSAAECVDVIRELLPKKPRTGSANLDQPGSLLSSSSGGKAHAPSSSTSADNPFAGRTSRSSSSNAAPPQTNSSISVDDLVAEFEKSPS